MTADRVQGRDETAIPRLVVYLVDGGGRNSGSWTVPPHVSTAIRGLRAVATRLVIGVRRPVASESRAMLEEVADSVTFGDEFLSHGRLVAAEGPSVSTFHQVVLTGSGWFGPVADVAAVLERMRDVAEWSLVPRGVGLPFEEDFVLGPDPDWYVLSGRRAVSRELSRWRRGGPLIPPPGGVSYAFAPLDFRSPEPVLMNLPDLIDAGVPFVPLRSMGVDPLVADRLAVVPGDGLERLRRTGIDMTEVWTGLLDRYPLRTLTTNLGLARVMGARPPQPVPTLRTVALLHLYYDDLTDDLMDRVDLIPGEVDVVVTTTDEGRRTSIEARLASRTRHYRHEVRVVASNRGRDISAFLVGCADVLADPSYDMVVKLHGKRSVQDDINASAWFRRHLLDNLLGSHAAVAELYDWFDSDSSLGIVVPPVIHQYYPTMGHAWLGNRVLAERLADRLGLTVPLDEHTPVAAYGSMFVARREALAPWLTLGLDYDDFPDGSGYADGTLAHAIERLFCYAAAGTGRYTGTVLGAGVAGIEYGFLEYKLQVVGARLPVYAIDQVDALTGRRERLRRALVLRLPGLAAAVRRTRRLLRDGGKAAVP